MNKNRVNLIWAPDTNTVHCFPNGQTDMKPKFPPRELCTVNLCTSRKIAVEINHLETSDIAQKVGISDSRHPRKTITKKYLIGNHSRLQESLTKWN